MSFYTTCETLTRKHGHVVARVLLALPFLYGGYTKIIDPAMTAGYMSAAGIPQASILVWVAIAIEILGGLALVFGYKVRQASEVLIGFTIVVSVIFHGHLSDSMQAVQFLKNLGLIAGLLLLSAHRKE